VTSQERVAFAPEQMDEALRIYRRDFQPSVHLERPYVMLGFNSFAAASDEEGQLLATSLAQAFVALRTGNPGQLKPPLPGYLESLPAEWRASLDERLAASAIGARPTVQAATEAFIARTGADELMVAAQIFDHRARLDSYRILAEALGQAPATAAPRALASA